MIEFCVADNYEFLGSKRVRTVSRTLTAVESLVIALTHERGSRQKSCCYYVYEICTGYLRSANIFLLVAVSGDLGATRGTAAQSRLHVAGVAQKVARRLRVDVPPHATHQLLWARHLLRGLQREQGR